MREGVVALGEGGGGGGGGGGGVGGVGLRLRGKMRNESKGLLAHNFFEEDAGKQGERGKNASSMT